jgi:hypothetical protein
LAFEKYDLAVSCIVSAPRFGGQVHPEEREETNVGARVALVEIVRESRTATERSPDRGPTEGENGESFPLPLDLSVNAYVKLLTPRNR